jgi:hypothetical protein
MLSHVVTLKFDEVYIAFFIVTLAVYLTEKEK